MPATAVGRPPGAGPRWGPAPGGFAMVTALQSLTSGRWRPAGLAVAVGGLAVVLVAAFGRLGPVPVGFAAVGAVASLVLLLSGRLLPLALLPASVLAPQNLRLKFGALPDVTVTRALIVLCVVQVAFEAARRESDSPALEPRLKRAMVAFTLLVGVNLVLTNLPGGLNRAVASTLELFVPVWLIDRALKRTDDLQLILRVLLLAAIVGSALGVVEFALQRFLLPAALRADVTSRAGLLRAQGLFPHSIVFGIFLQLMVLVGLACALGRRYQPRLARVAACLAAVALPLTLSRGPWLATVVGLVTLVALVGRRHAAKVVASALVALAVLVATPLGPTVFSLLGDLSPTGELRPGTTEVLARQTLFNATVEFARSNPFGVGMGALTNLQIVVSLRGYKVNQSFDSTYSILVFEVGPFGLLVFAAVIAAVLAAAVSARRRAPPGSDERLLAAGLVSALVSLVFVGFTVATLTWRQISLFTACLVGMTLGLRRLAAALDEDRTAAGEPADTGHEGAPGGPLAAAARR